METKTIGRPVSALVLWFVMAASTWSTTVQLSADRTRVGLGDVFSVTVAITMDDGSSAPDPDLMLPDGFELVGSRSSTSTSISIVQGAVTQTTTVNVVSTVRANKEGRFTVGPATIKAGGKTLRSQNIRIDVVKGQAQPRASTQPGRNAVTADQLEEIEQNLFISTRADRKTVYVGEQILLSYDLFSRYRIQNPKFGTVPSFTGFWAEPVFEASRLEQRPEVVNGRSFNKSKLKQMALFPTIPGTHKVEQLEFICDIPIRSRRRSLFDSDDFFSWDPFRSRQVTVRAEDIVFEVRSLPSGAPDSFSGGVGAFDISASVSPTAITQGDPITVVVKVSGRGNIHGVGEPQRPTSTTFKFYDPKGEVEAHVDGTVLTGTKTFEYVAIPSTSGRVQLPSFELAYFDPSAKQYATARTGKITLDVTPGQEVAQVSMAAPTGKSVELMGEDIRFIKPDITYLADQSLYLHQSGWIWSLNGLPALGLLIAWQWRRRQQQLLGDVAYVRKRRSRTEADRRLGEARHLQEGDGVGFHTEIQSTVSAFLSDRLNLDVAGLTADQAQALLTEKTVDAVVITQVVEVLQACDYARFAPGASDVSDRADLLNKTQVLIDALERAV